LFDLDIPWLSKLVNIQDVKDLENIIDELPLYVQKEAKKLIDIVSAISYKNLTISPLYYSAMKYYDNIYYRVIENNLTLAKGGQYKSDGVDSLGFALYTDNLLKTLED
jgi:histidyl-tRNA synthetase